LIPQGHVKQLVHAATSLSGPKLETALWQRLDPFCAAGSTRVHAQKEEGRDPEPPADPRRLRAMVAADLRALARRAETTLASALASARQAWDKVDNHMIIDPALAATLSVTRRRLQLAAEGSGPTAAVALEGIIALEVAGNLCALMERRLSSLIRLRVQQSEELLPDGRPFLDLGAALAEVARAWD
jgi:hypothetical protein